MTGATLSGIMCWYRRTLLRLIILLLWSQSVCEAYNHFLGGSTSYEIVDYSDPDVYLVNTHLLLKHIMIH